MEILVDTGILLRLAILNEPDHPETLKAVRFLKVRGDRLVSLAQNAAEFWNVCTRPASTTGKGGYGFSITDTQQKLDILEQLIEFRANSQAGYEEWKRLIVTHRVSGVQVHDTNLVAAMIAQGITHIVTFNKKDFKRFPGITASLPSEVLNAPPSPSTP